MNWQERIGVTPETGNGKVCVAGTRIMVTVTLDNLAEGVTEAEVLRSCPTLTSDDVMEEMIAFGRATTLLSILKSRARRTLGIEPGSRTTT